MIAIVGGGLTGLVLGHHLAASHTPHLVLEASDRPGGVIRSGRVQGHLLEWGPQRGRLTASLHELVAVLGIAGEVITAPPGLPLLIYHSGKLRRVPFSPGEFLRSDIIRWPAKLRLLLEPLTAGPREEESVAEFFSRKIGAEPYEHVVAPLYGGLYASDPARMQVGLSLGHVLREFGIQRSLLLPLLRRGGRITPPPACSFHEGMQTLTDALFRSNRENVRLASPVQAIVRRDGAYALELEGGTLPAEQVVITSPAAASSRMLQEIAPEAAARIGQLVYNPLAVVHLYAETDLVGLGFQVSLRERLYTRGVTFNDSMFGRKGVYTVYLGGAKAPEVVGWDDEKLAAVAVREFRETTGFEAESLAVERQTMPAWDRSWAAIRDLRIPEGVHIAANWESRPGIPGRLAQAKRLAGRLAA